MSRVTGSDRLTAAERAAACDCLVEIMISRLTSAMDTDTLADRQAWLGEICLWVSQMRHRMPSVMDLERQRWLERVAVRICGQMPGAAGQEQSVVAELKVHTTSAMLSYHDWRERHAPVSDAPQRRCSNGSH